MNIHMLKHIYTDLKMIELPVKELSTENITVSIAFIGLNPVSIFYGKIIGFFSYNGKNYKFYYNVHRPKQGSPLLSNKMTSITEIIEEENEQISEILTNFGTEAFWENTPMSYLKKNGYENACMLRELMQSITQYSRKHDFCGKLRHRDKYALRENPIYQKRSTDR